MSDLLERMGGLTAAQRLLLEKVLRDRAAARRAAGRIRPRAEEGPVPLSSAQQRLWLVDRLQPGTAAYNLPAALRLRGRLQARTLERALGEIVRRHESLRTVFLERGGEPLQAVLPPAPHPLPRVDLGALPEEAGERELLRLAAAETARPFDLERGPLLRSTLVRLGAREHAVLFTVHHIVSDGWSMGVLVSELTRLYAAFAAGLPSPLAELEVQYADFALWQREQLSGAREEEMLAFWRRRLEGAPPRLDFPTDRPHPPAADPRGGQHTTELGLPATRALRELSRREGATLFMTLLAGWQALLSRWSGQDDVVVGSPVAGRTSLQVEGLIGMFVNTLVLRTDLSGDPTARELIARVREGVLEAQAHQELPFERLVEALAPERSPRVTPLFQVLFALQNSHDEELRLGELEMDAIEVEQRTTKFDLELSLAEHDGGMEVQVGYRAALFDAATAGRISRQLQALLAAMAAHPDRRLSEADLMAPGEREQVLGAWNATARAYPPLPAHRLFAEQAARTPRAPAVLFAGGSLTYAELDARAEAIAARLRALGVGPEAPVGLCVERAPEMMAAVLGIWKAGGACVPLDPAYPAERLALVARDAGLRATVASRGAADAVPEPGGETVLCDTPHPPAPSPTRGEGEHDGAEGGSAVAVAGCSLFPVPCSLAYVIYTSGSTGTPKGVHVEHGSLSNLLHAAREAFGVRAGDVVPVLASHAFDIWLFEAVLPLTVGAAVRLVGRERVMDPAGLVAEAGDATVLHAVPALMRQLAREAAASAGSFPGLRTVLVGGDLVAPELLAEMREAFPSAETWVAYGPTEGTVLASAHRVPRSGEIAGHRIGAPLGNVRLYVCDALGGAQPVGVPGELWIGGAGVARGYGGRPEATAERFVPDPFGGVAGARAYRTGDRARWRAEGELEFLGRTDAQVKIRGVRIEPGEVEAALRRHPAVREAVAAVREDGGERRLVAYVAAADGADVDAGELRAWLRGSLPDYMVPSAVVALDALPLTPTGKVDRRALPAPDASAGGAYTAPRGEAEERLAAIWAEVLGAERVGAHDDFFALGGHSLLATRVVSRVRETFGRELPLRALFESPTVAGLAAWLEPAAERDDGAGEAGEAGDAGRTASPAGDAGIRRVPRDRPLPVSFAQQRLWFIHQLEPESPAYNMPFPLRLGGALDVRALRRALAEIVRRHEALRTVFGEAGGEPVQVVRPAGPVPLPVVDLRALPAEAREHRLHALAREDSLRPFDLAAGPPLRAALLRAGEEEWALLLNVHHIVSDGWSTGILVGEFSALYGAFSRGEASPLPEPPVQYADFAAWQREWLSGPRMEAQLAYWRGRLAGAPPTLDLPTDHPRPAVPGTRARRQEFHFGEGTTLSLRGLCAREGITPFMGILAAWQLLLARYAGVDDVSVGTGIAGRNRLELEGLVGFFVNTLVLRTELAGNPTGRELLARVRETTLGAYAHQDVPFERLVEEVAPERSLAHAPLVQAMFTFQNLDPGVLELGGLRLEPLSSAGEAAKFDLSLTAGETETSLRGSLTCRADLFEPETVARMLRHLRVLLEGLAAEPGRPVAALPLMEAGERTRVLAAAAGPARARPRGLPVHALFERQAARTPDAVAAAFDGGSLTYAELDRRADAVAAELLRRRLAPETRVGVFLERGPEWLAALLGVLKAGAVYVPLDPANPAERIRYVLEDSGASLLLTGGALRARVPEFGGEVVVCDGTPLPPAPSPARGEGEHDGVKAGFSASDGALTPRPPLPMLGEGEHDEGEPRTALPRHGGGWRASSEPGGGHPADASAASVDPDSLAYVIYTSGSTGRPKGVLTTHGGVADYLAFLADEYGLGPADTVLQLATPTFDASIRETLGALTTGARLVLTPAAEAAEPRRVLERAREHGVTAIMAVVPSVLRPILAEAERSADAAAPLRLLLASGEPLPVADVRRARAVFGPNLRVVNQWGATECTMSSTLHTVTDDEATPIAPVGAPIPNTRVYVLDPEIEPVPLGVPGEAYIATPGLARGYGGRPELTAERFVPDPFSKQPGARMYRVGDRVRRRRDGVLEFLGRVDRQVKVQGVRVEPGEVEAALRAHPAVDSAAVVAREDRPGEARLVAYVVASGGAQPTAAELRAYLADRLPSYLVPSGWVGLDALPLLPNGKLDRRALPDPDEAAGEAEHVAPRTPTEEILAGIWAEVLGVETVGAADDFFALGGHSLLATRMAARVRGAFGVELPLRALFEAPTVGGAAARIDALLGEGAGSGVPPLVPVPRGGPLPLSFAQQRLWFIHQLAPAGAAYNMPHPLRMRGPLDVAALRRSLRALTARHESLRTVFAVADDEPVQLVRDPAAVPLPLADLSGLRDADRGAETRRLVGEETLRPFDLERGPLIRALLVRAGAEEHALLFTLHHVIADGWSLGVLTREVSATYGAFARGEEPRLPALPVQLGDFAAWQRAWLRGEALERQVAWWREGLAGAPPLLEVPTDRPRPAAMSEAGASLPFALSPETSRALLELSRREGATLFMTLLAGWQALLSRWSGQDDVVVGTPLAGRTRLETEGLIGMFVNTLALRADLSGRPDFRALLARVREAALGAYAHQEVPFEKLVEELRVERSLRHTPVFQALFALQNVEPGELRMGALEVEPLPRGEETAKFDLSLVLSEDGGRVGGLLSYRAELWEPATIGRMAEHLRVLLEGIAAAPGRPVAELPLMPAAERAQVLEAWNATAADRPAGLFHEMFEAQVRRAPDAPALLFAGTTVAYAELDRWANRLANHLRGLGVGPEGRVGVCLERGPSLVAAFLGVLKAGGAYVPLDPEYPAARLGHMLADGGVAAVLAHSATAAALPEHGAVVVRLDADRERIEAESDASPRDAEAVAGCPLSPVPSPLSLAYVIYTSGSTGTPKGVLVPHAGLCNVARAQARDLGVGPGDRVLQAASPSFDASVFEIAMALGTGAALCLGTRDELAPGPELVRLLRGAGVTAATLSPSALAALPDDPLPALRTLATAGEACPAELVDRWAPGRRFLNLYGPTEATIWSTTAACEPGGAPPPIGRPVANTTAYVLDAGMEPVPVGVPGELYVGGAGVARGYGGRPALTAERFVPDPFGGGAGARLYRTGDRARWLARGELEFLGRVDAQVKIRGFRVEPGEVEAALRAHPAVRDAVAVVREDAPGDRRLVAYVTAGGAADPPAAGELRAWLRERVPEHMVPSAWVALEGLPLTPNGKLDRAALPAPGDASGGSDYAAPRTPVEEVLAGIFAEVLRAGRVGIHDDFFALGGHSLLATRVASRVREAFGVEMPLRALFEAPSVAELAGRVSSLRPTAQVEEWEMEEEMAKLADLSEEEVQRLLREF